MKLTIQGNGVDPDDDLVRFLVIAENDSFKGTAEFYHYADAFKELSTLLADFPFKSAKPIEYKTDKFAWNISLADPAGLVNFKLSLKDSNGNSASFNDQSVETSALQRLASMLDTTNFDAQQKVEWSSRLE